MYECSSNEALVLHPRCLKLPHSKTSSDHGVSVTLREQVSLMRSKCQICNRRKLQENIEGWAYVSDCGKHRYHVACVKDMIFNNLHNIQVLAPTEGSNTSTLSLRVQQSVFNVKNFRKYGGRIIKLIIEVIISAIFGDAFSIILTLAEVIQRNQYAFFKEECQAVPPCVRLSTQLIGFLFGEFFFKIGIRSFQFQYVVLDEDSFMLTGIVGLICFSFARMSRLTWQHLVFQLKFTFSFVTSSICSTCDPIILQ